MQSEEVQKVTACQRCRHRKAKCDKIQPACSACLKAGAQCLYSFRDPVARRQHTEELQRRLRRVELKNQALTRSLRDARVRSPATDGVLLTALDNAADNAQHSPSVEREESAIYDNEASNQFSYLSTSAGGPKNYLGSASGLLLANMLQINTPSNGEVGEYGASLARRFGNGNKQSGTTAPNRGSLPSENLARSLLKAYLSHDHLCYPFLHPQSLMAVLDAVYTDEKFYETYAVEAFTIDMILAIATAQVHKFVWQVLPDAETHHDRAMSRLDQVLKEGGMTALQTVLLICQYRMLSLSSNTSASLWYLIGMAARMCFELGLHRESVYLIQHSNTETRDELKEVCELKRRCFWCVFAMDRIASTILGRPLAIQLDDVDTELLFVDESIQTSPSGPLSPADNFDDPQWQPRNAIFVHIIRYRMICGKILTGLHNTTKKRREACNHNTIQQDLAQELDEWRNGIDSLPLVDINSAVNQDKSSFRSREWYHLLYYNGVLMLYRPTTTLQDLPRSSEILQSIFQAAQQSIITYAYLHRSRKINYSWITLHTVFIAGLSYIYAVRSHFQTRCRQLKMSMNGLQGRQETRLTLDPSIGQIVSDTRACSTVLVALSERWETARTCHDVFGRLTDAALADAVEFSTQTSQTITAPPPTSQSGQDQWSSATEPQMIPLTATSNIANVYHDCFTEFEELFGNQYTDTAMMRAPQDWIFEIQALNEGF